MRPFNHPVFVIVIMFAVILNSAASFDYVYLHFPLTHVSKQQDFDSTVSTAQQTPDTPMTKDQACKISPNLQGCSNTALQDDRSWVLVATLSDGKVAHVGGMTNRECLDVLYGLAHNGAPYPSPARCLHFSTDEDPT